MAYSNPLLYKPGRLLPKHVGIIGAGTIGPDIGYYLKSALPDIRLTLVDIDQSAADKAVQRCHDYARKAVDKGKMDAELATSVTANISGTLDYNTLADADWVIEAATENIALKRQIFSRLEGVMASDALITSNTSSLPAERLFSHLRHKERTTVTHFFAPAWRNPAVEVIEWAGADPDVINYLRWLFCFTGKTPMLTSDAVCFMLDRIFDNWCNDAALLLNQASSAEIDTVVRDYVHAGPFFVLNLANGNPIITETNSLQAEEEGAHYAPAPIFRSVQTWLTNGPGKAVSCPAAVEAIVRDRMLGILFSQSVDILDRKIGEASDLEIGCKLALGFKAGPLTLMRDLGEAETRRIFDLFGQERPGMPMPKQPLSAYQQFYRHILVDDIDQVKVITLRRPEALNALHDELTDEVLDVIRRHESLPNVRGFVITGYSTKAFCAGADIGRFSTMLGNAEAATQYARDCSRLLVHLDAMKKPVVAALNGMTIGGGLELATRCHGIVAVQAAWMQFPEITLGIVPGIGAMVVPYRRWPQAVADFNEMLRRAVRLSATRAHEIGVIDKLADNISDLIDIAVQRVGELTGTSFGISEAPVKLVPFVSIDQQSSSGQILSRQALKILEDAIAQAAAKTSLRAALEVGYRAFGESACTAAAREGITAFGQGRKPDFSTTP